MLSMSPFGFFFVRPSKPLLADCALSDSIGVIVVSVLSLETSVADDHAACVGLWRE